MTLYRLLTTTMDKYLVLASVKPRSCDLALFYLFHKVIHYCLPSIALKLAPDVGFFRYIFLSLLSAVATVSK